MNMASSFQKIYLLFKRGKDVLSHEIVLGNLPPSRGATNKGRKFLPFGNKFFPLRVTHKFGMIQLAPFK